MEAKSTTEKGRKRWWATEKWSQRVSLLLAAYPTESAACHLTLRTALFVQTGLH